VHKCKLLAIALAALDAWPFCCQLKTSMEHRRTTAFLTGNSMLLLLSISSAQESMQKNDYHASWFLQIKKNTKHDKRTNTAE